MISILVLLSIAAYQTDATCVNLFDVVQHDTYFEHHLLGKTKAPSVFDCAVFCQAHARCFSFGFEPQKRICHLHNSHEACAPSDIIAKRHWIHGEIADFPKSLWGPCSDHHCGIGQKCTTNRVTKGAECVKGNLAVPENHCPFPHPLMNAVRCISGWGPEAVTTYTCREGYLDTTRSLDSAVFTCDPNLLQWSRAAFTCSGPFVRVEKSAGHIFDEYIENLPDKTFQNVTGGTSSLVFFYKGCQNCVVTLCYADGLPVQECYYACIGRTVAENVLLRAPGNTEAAKYHEDGIVSCTKFNPFWITWDHGVIALGKGETLGEQQILSIQLLSPYEVNNIGLSVYKDTNGTWLLYRQN